MVTKQDQALASAFRRLEQLNKQECFDPIDLNSLPTPAQKQVLDDFGKIHHQYIRAGNQSGKSQVCARITSWVLAENHPTWKRPVSWSNEPLLLIIAGATGKQIEDSLLPKIESYLESGTYKIVRIGNIVQRLEHENGNRILFQSLENPQAARIRLQSYVAHLAWCDELPPTMDLIRELLIRTQARDGYNLFSFTPTVVNVEIQKYIDGLQSDNARVYRFKMMDNPIYKDESRKKKLQEQYAYLPADQQKMIFEGEWLSSDSQVYYFDWDKMVETPVGYTRMWRHVAAVDPATQSKLGLTIWAEDPKTTVWYNVRAEYIEKIYIPTEIIKAVENILKDYNVTRRISDPEASWYINQASQMGHSYIGVFKKNGRKAELIAGLQERLGNGKAKLTPEASQLLISELQECRYRNREEGSIINSSKFHLLDSAQYFIDNIPRQEDRGIVASSHDEWLYKANEQRLVAEERAKTRKKNGVRPSKYVLTKNLDRWINRK